MLLILFKILELFVKDVDEKGSERIFVIEESGMDGSLIVC